MSGTTITDVYVLSLVDKITHPLHDILEGAKRAKKTLEELQKLTGGGIKMVALIAGVKGAQLAFSGLKTAATGAMIGIAALFAAGAGAAAKFGHSVVEAARFAQTSKMSLDIFLGAGKGEGVFNRALQFGNVLPMDERDVVKQVQSLAGAGYKGDRLSSVNAALADVQALRGDSYRENLEFHFLRLKNEAKPDAKDVKMAAIDTGIGMEGLMTELFNLKGVKVPTTITGMEKLYDSMKKSGKITGIDVADAIVNGIDNRFNGGKGLGSSAKRIGMSTLSGLFSNMAAAPRRFLMQLGVEKFAGIQSLMAFMRRILEYFNLATAQGQKLATVAEKLTNSLLGGLDNLDDDALAKFFEAGVGAAETLADALKGAWNIVGKLLHGNWGDLGGAVVDALSAVAELLGGFIVKGVMHVLPKSMGGDGGGARDSYDTYIKNKREYDERWKGLKELPTGPETMPTLKVGSKAWMLANAHREGTDSAAKAAAPPTAQVEVSAIDYMRKRGIQAAIDSGEDHSEGFEKGTRDKGKTHSPSKVMEEVGEDFVDGLLEGIRNRIKDLRSGGGANGGMYDALIEMLRGVAHSSGAVAG